LREGISADTIVPEPGSSQAYDRYAYSNNNPINYNDPSGHRICDDGDADGKCDNLPGGGGGGGSSGGGSGGGGGGNSSGNSGSNNSGSRSQLPIVDSYLHGWQLAGTAWWILNNPDAGIEDWAISGGYIVGWVGAHAALAVGVGGLACAATGPACVAAVEGVLGIGGSSEMIRQGTTVLGKFPEYLQVAKDIGGKTFNVPNELWNKLTPSEQWALNQQFRGMMQLLEVIHFTLLINGCMLM